MDKRVIVAAERALDPTPLRMNLGQQAPAPRVHEFPTPKRILEGRRPSRTTQLRPERCVGGVQAVEPLLALAQRHELRLVPQARKRQQLIRRVTQRHR